jgi:PPK2 family polyphosphate:nucleotide phosphotransferase
MPDPVHEQMERRMYRSPHTGPHPPSYPDYRAEPGAAVDLERHDPDAHGTYPTKREAQGELDRQRDRIRGLQKRLYAESRHSLLVVLQAMNTGGKDGTIKHVFSGVNPQGCRVWSFKQPSAEELAHHFLWRYQRRAPARGMITIFNRSHYEDVLIVRVKELVPASVWERRYEAINHFEHSLALEGVVILKFSLNISRAEQKRRLQSRLDDPSKRWKFSADDVRDRALWDDYRVAYQDAISQCSTPHAPWYIVPANRKWYRNLVVARTIADALEAMDPRYPPAEEGLDRIVIPD